MNDVIQRLQELGYHHEEIAPEDLVDQYSEAIADGWTLIVCSRRNLMVVAHPNGLVAINANDFNVLPQVFWDATKKLIDDTLNSRASIQMELLKRWMFGYK